MGRLQTTRAFYPSSSVSSLQASSSCPLPPLPTKPDPRPGAANLPQPSVSSEPRPLQGSNWLKRNSSSLNSSPLVLPWKRRGWRLCHLMVQAGVVGPALRTRLINNAKSRSINTHLSVSRSAPLSPLGASPPSTQQPAVSLRRNPRLHFQDCPSAVLG